MAFRLVNRHKMLAPAKCLLCENPPYERVVDTGFKFVAVPAGNPLRGRKYICETCASKAAKAFGFVQQQKYEDTLQQLIDAKNEVDRLSSLVESFDAFDKWLEMVSQPQVVVPTGNFSFTDEESSDEAPVED